MTEQWQELKETITEMRDNDGTGTQQEVCKFLTNLMDVLEKQMSDEKNQNKGEWIAQDIHNCHTYFKCSKCGYIHVFMHLYGEPTADYTYCPNCGAKMERGET
jgi:predicted RNA-binding Zn-ribbon protein involved in translation (DUF1610 family)